MTRSRSTSSRQRRTGTAPVDQTWDDRIIRGLTPWKWEIAGLLLFVMAIVTMLGYLNVTRSGLLDPWTTLLRQIAGWGVLPLCLTVALLGLYLVIRRLELQFTFQSSQLIGIEIILLVTLALSHLFFGNGLNGALLGKGGGLIGWALSEPIVEFLGPTLAGVVALITVAIGVVLVAKIGYGDVVMWLNRSSIKLLIWSDEIDMEVAERQAQMEQARLAQSSRQNSGQDGASVQSQNGGMVVIDRSAAARAKELSGGNTQLPPLSLLDEGTVLNLSEDDIDEKKRIIEQTLSDFGLPATITEVRRGPAVTQFGVLPGYNEKSGPDGEMKQYKVRVGQIAALQKDLALALQVSRLRIEAPVPGRGIVGVEVPNSETKIVSLRAIIESEAFQKVDSFLAVGLGRDVSGAPVATDLGALPHLLIAGTTGSGKSVCLNAIITCLVFNNPPERLRLVMIDPKKVEFIRFNGLPHLLGKVEVEGERIIGVLRWLAIEMDRRYQVFEQVGARNLQEYNKKISRSKDPKEKKMPLIGVFIDELADLITSYTGDVERTLCRLAQMARATGIHLVVATQRPSTDVITGLIKANFPARASFSVASNTDSRVILDSIGAEQLLGRGDMLFLSPDASAPVRLQGCFVSDHEMERVVEYWQVAKGEDEPEPEPVIDETKEESPWDKMIVRSNYISERDEMLEEVIELAKKRDSISTSFIQRKLRIGYPRAARLMEALHELGLVDDPKEGGKTRRILLSGEEDPLGELLDS